MDDKGPYFFGKLNSVSLDAGLKIDGTTVKGIQKVDIKSDASNVSQITITFLGKVEDLDTNLD
jgi:hypothetical protein